MPFLDVSIRNNFQNNDVTAKPRRKSVLDEPSQKNMSTSLPAGSSPPKNRTGFPNSFSLLGTAGVMGLHMISGPIVGGGLGWLLDGWLSTGRICAGIGALLGFAAGFLNVWIDAKFLIRGNESSDKKKELPVSDSARNEKKSDEKMAADAFESFEKDDEGTNCKKEDSSASLDGFTFQKDGSEKKKKNISAEQKKAKDDENEDEEAFLLASLFAGTRFTKP